MKTYKTDYPKKQLYTIATPSIISTDPELLLEKLYTIADPHTNQRPTLYPPIIWNIP